MEHTYYDSDSWVTDGFPGTMFRDFNGDSLDNPTLLAQVDTASGGWDTGIQVKYDHHDVDSIHPSFWVRANYNVTASGTGDWWVGPKINVNWKEGGTDRYENYIVENSSKTPSEWDTELIADGTYLGQTFNNGQIYKHYIKAKSTWWQIWAIRQSYRNGGIVSLARMVRFWRRNSVQKMSNGTAAILRINVETFGQVDFEADINNVYIPENYTSKPKPRFTPCAR